MSPENRQFIHESSPYIRHPFAAIFPMMTTPEMGDLTESMKDHGFREEETIVLHEGMVLDGSNRLRAALMTNTKPLYRNYDPTYDGPALKFVMDKNFNRRHMSAGQRAAVAAEYLPFAQEAAKVRVTANKAAAAAAAAPLAPAPAAEGGPTNVLVFTDEDPLGIGAAAGAPPEGAAPLAPPVAPPLSEADQVKQDKKDAATLEKTAVQLVAEKFGTGTTSVKLAKKLKEKALDLYEKVLRDELTLNAATEEFKKREEERTSGAKKEQKRTERRQAINDLVTKYGAEHRITEAAKEKKICKDHDDLLIFAGLVEAEGKKLFPLMFAHKWSVERTQKFLSGKPGKDSTAEDLANFARAHITEDLTEYVVELFGFRFTLEKIEKAAE